MLRAERGIEKLENIVKIKQISESRKYTHICAVFVLPQSLKEVCRSSRLLVVLCQAKS